MRGLQCPILKAFHNFGKTFLFLVKLYSEAFARSSTQVLHRFFSLFKNSFTRTISPLGGHGGPEKDQVFKVS